LVSIGGVICGNNGLPLDALGVYVPGNHNNNTTTRDKQLPRVITT
jgi:histidinol dehydrogenase